MSALAIKIRAANRADLDIINQIIEAAVMTWNLPERVKRLSLPSYRYTLLDFEHFEFKVAEDEQQKIVAVAAWEPADLKDTPEQQSGLLLHGLYVHPDARKQGIATQLIHAAERAAQSKGLSGLLVKAQTDAVGFFTHNKFEQLKVRNPASDYVNRLWKSL